MHLLQVLHLLHLGSTAIRVSAARDLPVLPCLGMPGGRGSSRSSPHDAHGPGYGVYWP